MKPTVIAAALALSVAACGSNPPVKGANLVADAVDDHKRAVNAKGRTPSKPLASADIRGILMDSDGTTLTIKIKIGGPPLQQIPLSDLRGPAWFVQLWETDGSRGAPAYFVVVTRDGAPGANQDGTVQGWRLSVCKGTEVCKERTPGTKLTITGVEVRADIPLTKLDKLQNPFSWVALSYWNDSDDATTAWSDYVPDAARPQPGAAQYPPPDARALFPPKT